MTQQQNYNRCPYKLYYSMRCPHSKKMYSKLENSSLWTMFEKVDVDTQPVTDPGVTRVPTIIVDKQILTGKMAIQWLNNEEQSNSLSYSLQNTDNFSFIDSGTQDRNTSSYSFIKDTPPPSNSSHNVQNTQNSKAASLDNAYDKMMAERQANTPIGRR